MADTFRGAIGKKIILSTVIDISTADTLKIQYEKPSGAVGEWTAAEETTTSISYTTTAVGDLDENGVWKFSSYISGTGLEDFGEVVELLVHEPLETTTDILREADFDAVRSLIEVDSAIVSDSVLASFPYLPTLEILVKDAVTDWATLQSVGGDDWTLLKTGTACLLAIRVVRTRFTSSQSSGFRVGGYEEKGREIELHDLVNRLTHMAKEAFMSISTAVLARPTFIMGAGPTSSGYNVPTDWEQWLERIMPRVIDWIQEDGEDDVVIP